MIRAVLAAFCTALMFYQWLIYRKTNRGMQLLFLSLVVGGLALSSVWIVLNVIRFHTYDPESNRVWAWHMLIVQIQEMIKWAVVGLAAVAFLCGVLLLAGWINKRLFAAS